MGQGNVTKRMTGKVLRNVLAGILLTCAAFLIVSCGAQKMATASPEIASDPKTSPGSKTSSADALTTFSRRVKNDGGLTPAEKDQWIRLAGTTFEGKSFSFNYGNLIYGIFSQAKFDEVDMGKAAQVALTSVQAVNQGAPAAEVSDLALLAFSVNLTSDETRLYAIAMKTCNETGIPRHVTQEMIRHAKEGGWTEHAFGTIMNGLAQAARENLDTEKAALFMLISVAQNLGTPERIVQDALTDGRKRAPVKSPQATIEANTQPDVTKPSRVALDYDNFRNSVESFIGTPYVWGGNTRTGVDCSGFTRLVLNENGYQIPRVSRDQAKVGVPVQKDGLHLGDLVFFDTKGQGQITHVGIYLGGNILVHASSSKGVTIVLFSDKYFQSRYVSARRIVRYSTQ